MNVRPARGPLLESGPAARGGHRPLAGCCSAGSWPWRAPTRWTVYYEMYRGAFGTWFSVQNTLQRAAPLMLTALCVALPARLGLIVIGAEGALVLGGPGARWRRPTPPPARRPAWC